jgi:YidC/Oxa1 family membrane protein insertase
MDKNQITGLVLISLLLFIYIYYFSPKPSKQPQAIQNTEIADSLNSNRLQSDSLPTYTESASPAGTGKTTGEYSAILSGQAKDVVIENEDVIYIFSSRGGIIKDVQLKRYLNYTKEPLHLVDEGSSRISEVIYTRDGNMDINKFYFRPSSGNKTIKDKDTLNLDFMAEINPGKFIRRSYRIPGKGYKILQYTKLSGLENDLTRNTVDYMWEANIRNSEKDIKTSQQKTTINYYTTAGELTRLKESSLNREQRSVTEPVNWMAIKQKFFTNAIIGNKPFSQGYFMTEAKPGSDIVKHTIFSSSINISDYQQGYAYYFGPNNYQILKKVTPGFAKNVYLGWPPVIYVNQYLIIPIFNWMERYISNYGIIIILLVIIVKIILFPLSYNSYISMAKTKVLKPQIDALKQLYGEDMQKMQSEQMKLYQQVGINPLSGCIPVLLQMPILFSMFYFFPNSIELRQEHLLWADDLSTYDSILNLPFMIPGYGNHVSLFTILMTASTILYTWSTSQMTSVTGPMKTMQYIMPVIFMFALNSFPAALSFYYFVSNIITFGQQALIRRFVDESKIERILEENKKKNATKKKSRFQERLEEAMKATEEAKKKPKK